MCRVSILSVAGCRDRQWRFGRPGDVKSDLNRCEFIRQQPHGRYRLRIEVRRVTAARDQFASYRAHCGHDAVPLKAIGNEAFLCPKKREIVGRVRDALFTVGLSTPDRATRAEAWEPRTKEVAEEVAGALF